MWVSTLKFFFDHQSPLSVFFKSSWRGLSWDKFFINDWKYWCIFKLNNFSLFNMSFIDTICSIKLYLTSWIQKLISTSKQTLLLHSKLFLSHLVFSEHFPTPNIWCWRRFNEFIIIVLLISDHIFTLRGLTHQIKFQRSIMLIHDWMVIDRWFCIHALSKPSFTNWSCFKGPWNYFSYLHLIMEKSSLPGFLLKEFNYTI